jgi:hypothetical protein
MWGITGTIAHDLTAGLHIRIAGPPASYQPTAYPPLAAAALGRDERLI